MSGLSRQPIVRAPHAPFARPRMLQRKCACGASNQHGEMCDECKKKVQTKLAVGSVDDPLEREADRIADRVLSSSAPGAVGDAPIRVQRAGGEGAGTLQAAPASVERTLAHGGRPLEPALRHDMAQRFGHDFFDVRVHTDSDANASARDIGAQAYTSGADIVFAAGRYSPGTREGQRLLAHELTHVLQQSGGVVRCAPDAKALKEFDERAKKLKEHPVYKKQKANEKTLVAEILTIIRTRDDALAQMSQLELLFNTPEGKEAERTEAVNIEIGEAEKANTERMTKKTSKAPKHKGDEEAVSAAKGRVFSKRKGRDGSLFQIDARDVTDVALIVQVHLTATKKTKDNTDAITKIVGLEDAIEKHIATLGYSLDLKFVDKGGPEVFTINVDTGKWADAGNIAGGDATFAHELHHLLGLEEDRYDYTSHATNKAMPVDTRIYWFHREFKKTVTNDPESIMNDENKQPLDDDVCMVAGKTKKSDVDACVKQRVDARNKIIDPAISKARGWATKANARVASDKFLTTGLDVAAIVERPFGGKFPLGTARTKLPMVDKTMASLKTTDMKLVSALIDVCIEDAPLTSTPTLPLELCPQFFRMALTDQARGLLRGAFHIAGIGGAGKDQDCSAVACTKPCGGGKENADQWARFTQCIAEL
jgi:hypothetical protein